jgi:hypothetical protein
MASVILLSVHYTFHSLIVVVVSNEMRIQQETLAPWTPQHLRSMRFALQKLAGKGACVVKHVHRGTAPLNKSFTWGISITLLIS